MKLSELLDELGQLTVEHGKGATEYEVLTAESQLQVTFPNDYRAFLLRFGWAYIRHWEVFGLGADAPNHVELQANTRWLRANIRLPLSLIPIGEDGGGNFFCLDTSCLHCGRCPVVFWDHDQDEDQVPCRWDDDFEHRLFHMIRWSDG